MMIASTLIIYVFLLGHKIISVDAISAMAAVSHSLSLSALNNYETAVPDVPAGSESVSHLPFVSQSQPPLHQLKVGKAQCISQEAASMILNGILQTYESGDDIFLSDLMDPKSRYTNVKNINRIEIKETKQIIEKSILVGNVKVYRPVLFQKIRKSIGMTEEDYLQCLDFTNIGMNCLTDSDSKSGQTFWISKNEKIVLKTIKKYECKNLYKILTEYSLHLKECSGRSCISTVLGLYRVTLKQGGRRYFMVSRNVYPINGNSDKNTNMNLDIENNGNYKNEMNDNRNSINDNFNNDNINNNIMKKYDLKGSTIGRTSSLTSSVMKDLNLISSGNIFPLGEKVKKSFLQILEKDVLFLKKYFFMDYSLLVAVEDNSRAFGLNSKDRFFDSISALPCDSGKLVVLGADGLVYHFGLIDFLQKYSFRKLLETWFKGLYNDPKRISAVRPTLYATRMLYFLAKYTE